MLLLLFAGCAIQQENYNKNYKLLYLGNSNQFVSTWINKGIKIDAGTDLTNYKNYDIVIVDKEFISNIDVETSKKAILEGKGFFFMGLENDQFIQSNYFNQKSSRQLLEGYCTIQLYNYGDKIQSLTDIFKKNVDHMEIYKTLIKDYENKHQINK